MNENEVLAPETGAENVEQTTEETPVKTYTQEEVDAIVGKRIARTKAKIEKDYQRKYGGLEDVLRAGTGKESVEEMTDTFADFYRKKGITIPDKPAYSAKDLEVLARAEAEEIIRSGYDEVVEEVDRLTELGAAKMTPREKAVFKALAEYRQGAERGKELSALGVTEDVYNSQEFRDYVGMFKSDVPIQKIYENYAKTQPKKDIKPMGSMKSNVSTGGSVKDFYSFEEARKFTNADYDKNPGLEEAVKKSMMKWKK